MAQHPDPRSVVDCKFLHPVLSVRDPTASVRFYTERLGFVLGFSVGDPVRFAGVSLGFASMHLRQGAPNPASAAVYFVVDDVDALYELHAARGLATSGSPADKPHGLREYEVQDLDGYTLTFGQHVPPREPKIDIVRIDFPVRLEARLAALLTDLAAHKKMSVGEVLEETLLHSFEERSDGGVADPHGRGTHQYIAQLKREHGVDYDSHDVHRFIEKP